MNPDTYAGWDFDEVAAYEHGISTHRVKLARVLNEARQGNEGAGDYFRALHDIAEAMGLREVVDVRYTA